MRVGDVGGVHAGHEYVGGTCGSCIVSGAADMLGMSVVRGMRGLGGLCELCLARGGEWGNRGSVRHVFGLQCVWVGPWDRV